MGSKLRDLRGHREGRDQDHSFLPARELAQRVRIVDDRSSSFRPRLQLVGPGSVDCREERDGLLARLRLQFKYLALSLNPVSKPFGKIIATREHNIR